MQAPLHGAFGDRQDLRHAPDGHVHEIAQHERVLHLLRQRSDGIPENGRVDFAENPVGRLRVGRGVQRAGLVDGHPVRLPPHVLGVLVFEDFAHPSEKGGLFQVGVDARDDFGQRAVDEFLGVAFVGVKTPRQGHETGLVFAFKPFCAAFAVRAEFFDDRGHFTQGGTAWFQPKNTRSPPIRWRLSGRANLVHPP